MINNILNYIKNNVKDFLIIIILSIILLQTCGKNKNINNQPTKDSVIIVKEFYHDSTINSKPQLINTIQPLKETITQNYIPDTNYNDLKKQFLDLAAKFESQNIQKDTLKIDSLGYVATIDTTQQNVIKGRSFKYDLKTKEITKTITIHEPYKPVDQVYIGGGIFGSKGTLVGGGEAGFMFKDKKDQLYGAKVQLNTLGQLSYGIDSYWKISLRKK